MNKKFRTSVTLTINKKITASLSATSLALLAVAAHQAVAPAPMYKKILAGEDTGGISKRSLPMLSLDTDAMTNVVNRFRKNDVKNLNRNMNVKTSNQTAVTIPAKKRHQHVITSIPTKSVDVAPLLQLSMNSSKGQLI